MDFSKLSENVKNIQLCHRDIINMKHIHL